MKYPPLSPEQSSLVAAMVATVDPVEVAARRLHLDHMAEHGSTDKWEALSDTARATYMRQARRLIQSRS